jgi:hypothetical protein|tara:strand:+ start:102 stop:260 length:159 start_codon:yes stop_codon:yes gene_type:complete
MRAMTRGEPEPRDEGIDAASEVPIDAHPAFDQVPAIDVIDGELVPRSPRTRP